MDQVIDLKKYFEYMQEINEGCDIVLDRLADEPRDVAELGAKLVLLAAERMKRRARATS